MNKVKKVREKLERSFVTDKKTYMPNIIFLIEGVKITEVQ